MDVDILDVTIFDGHDIVPGNRVSIRSGTISEIGTGPAADPAAETIDGAGGLLTPGFVDAHVHTSGGGLESLTCDLSDVVGVDAVRARIAAHLEATEGWLTGGGWSMADFPGGAPRAELLDELSPDRPIMLVSADHHSAWVNSAAMALAGLDADTPTPAGGVIEKDADGTPTGCLHESAMDIVGAHLPVPTDAEMRAGLLAGQAELLALGITGWMDAIIGDYSGHRDAFDTYVRAVDAGELDAEVVGSLWWPRDVTDVDAQVATFLERKRTAGAFRTHSVKFMLDGIVESRTAAMSAEYTCACGGFGTSYFTRDHLYAAFAALDAAGFDIHCHAIGDAAVTAALDAFAAVAGSAAGLRPDARHHIAHVQVVDPADVPRFAELGITANLQALWACRDQQMIDLNIPCLGEERAAWQYPFRSFAEAGTHLAMGSDWPVSTPDPWQAVHVAVNRSHPEEADPAPLGPDQAIDVLTALRAYTAGSAHLLRAEHNGSIRLGEPANLALASADPFALDPADLHTITNRLTISGGRIVHRA
ncbi:amidohydrolase [Brevibacterium celere]|uniref:amidohydrolase n=1 Tax=Brevibacterium celere TaxID=225845 RepID=UPI0031DF0479